MAQRKLSRPILILATVAVLAGALTYAFWPRPRIVDLGTVTQGEMMLTIDEEGRTQVGESFMVSTPFAGRLLRVEVHSGDRVEGKATVVARMRPASPAALDVRTREQALAAVEAAEAALRVAEASLEEAAANNDLSQSDLDRTRRLASSGTVSEAALERAQGAARAAEARLHTAEAAIAQRRAELQSAQAQLIGFDDRGFLAALEDQIGDEIPIYAPVDGIILRVMLEDETTLPVGTPILEIGDISKDLQVVVDLISSDAVRVSEGDDVLIEDWGGPEPLNGTVTRIEPFGTTKVSALGVEEQRVRVEVLLASPPEKREGLGHGYRVAARIVIWRRDDAVIVPTSALFRDGADWAVFAVREGLAVLQRVRIGQNNGVQAEVLDGLDLGDRVVLFPPADLADGAAVEQRVIQ